MKKPPIFLLKLHQIPIDFQLRLEEALLRSHISNFCMINFGAPPAIVLGISAKVEEVIQLELYQKAPLPCFRRFSGGGTVVIDPNTLFITWICNHKDIPCKPFPRSIMAWTESFLTPVMPPGFRMRENDYVIDTLKFGGNAQSITKERWVHHSSLLWDFNPFLMNHLKTPPRMPDYRLKRIHADFLCCLKNYLENIEDLKKSLVQRLHEIFNVTTIQIEELLPYLEKPHRKATKCITMPPLHQSLQL